MLWDLVGYQRHHESWNDAWEGFLKYVDQTRYPSPWVTWKMSVRINRNRSKTSEMGLSWQHNPHDPDNISIEKLFIKGQDVAELHETCRGVVYNMKSAP